MTANYVFQLLNTSKEKKNLDILAEYQYPQRFGFPVILILDGDGKLIHTQNTAYFEENKDYSEKIIFGFLKDWSPAALDPKTYQKVY